MTGMKCLKDNPQAKDFVVYESGIARQIGLFAHEEMPLDVALIVDCSVRARFCQICRHAGSNSV
jgi:hypothetical protein